MVNGIIKMVIYDLMHSVVVQRLQSFLPEVNNNLVFFFHQ